MTASNRALVWFAATVIVSLLAGIELARSEAAGLDIGVVAAAAAVER